MLTTWTTKPPLFAPTFQPISILPSPTLKIKANHINPKMLLCLCWCLGFLLSPLPSSSSFWRGVCASSLPCYSIMRHRGSNAHHPDKMLVRRESLPPSHSLPCGTANADHFLCGQSSLPCLLGVICPVTSPLQVLFCFLPGNPGTPQKEESDLGFPHYSFRGPDMNLGQSIKELKLPKATPHSFFNL